MISIIIIVKNDKGIINTLNILNNIQKPTSTETIVIDASNNNLHDIQVKFPKIKWIPFKSNENKNITIPEQRNLGVKISKGNIIVFIDANCVPKNNWLTELYKYYLNENELIVAGATRPFNKKTVNTISDERYKKSKYLNGAPTINILIHKSVFKKIGYFDERYTYGSDVDFTWRAVKAGYKIRLAKKAIIYHDWGNFKEQINRMIRYGSVRPSLYIKHTNKIKDLFIGNGLTTLVYPFYIIFLPFIFIFPYYPLIILIPILKNIKHKPIEVTILNLAYGIGVIKGVFRMFVSKSLNSL